MNYFLVMAEGIGLEPMKMLSHYMPESKSGAVPTWRTLNTVWTSREYAVLITHFYVGTICHQIYHALPRGDACRSCRKEATLFG